MPLKLRRERKKKKEKEREKASAKALSAEQSLTDANVSAEGRIKRQTLIGPRREGGRCCWIR